MLSNMATGPKLWITLAAALMFCGCDSFSLFPQPAQEGLEQPSGEQVERSAAGPAAAPDRIIALLGGKPLTMSHVQPLLLEAAGGDVLSEIVLDEQIAAALRASKLAVGEEDVKQERQLMLRQLSDDPDRAERLLIELRERMGLGPRRFEMFLRRYAALRKLIAGEVNVTEGMVRQAYEQAYAQQTVCRLILVQTLNQASEVMRRLDGGANFTDLAIELSRDSSRNQGGLLPPISPFDPTFPAAITEAVSRMVPGQVSDPIALDNGFAILKCEEKLDVEVAPFEEVAPDLRDQVRRRLEGSLMQRRIRILMQEADVTVLDAILDREFQRSRRGVLEGE